MSLTEKEAEIIQSGITGAMDEAKKASTEAGHACQAVMQLAEQMRLLQESMQQVLAHKEKHPGVCPHCGASLNVSH